MARKYTCLLTKELAVFLLLGLYSASVVHGAGKVLVLVDNINTQDTHSIFLNSLKGIKYSCLLCVSVTLLFLQFVYIACIHVCFCNSNIKFLYVFTCNVRYINPLKCHEFLCIQLSFSNHKRFCEHRISRQIPGMQNAKLLCNSPCIYQQHCA